MCIYMYGKQKKENNNQEKGEMSWKWCKIAENLNGPKKKLYCLYAKYNVIFLIWSEIRSERIL